MKQRVLIVHNDYQLSGGESNVAENEARMLSEHGHTVIFYRRNNAEIASYGALAKLRLAFATFFSFRTYHEVRALIREKQISVVHVHNTVPLISPSVYYAAWAEHVPVVQTVHNYRFLCPNGMFYRDGHICEDCLRKGLFCAVRYGCYRHSRIQSLVLSSCILLHRLLGTYKRIDAYICLTAFGKEKLSHKLPSDRIYLKPNIVSVNRAPIPYAQHGENYVFLGRLDAEKGVLVLVEAFEKLPQRKLFIIGSGPEEAKLHTFIAEHDVHNVVMLGQLPHEAAIGYVANARALVMPTQWYEGLPLTVLEAFALGTPVFGSNVGNVGAVLAESRGGFAFDQTDPQSIADCIAECSGAALVAASENGILVAMTAYAPETNYETLLAIYRMAAERQGIRQ